MQNTLILVNGIEAHNLEGVKTIIEEGDELTLIPVIHGGWRVKCLIRGYEIGGKWSFFKSEKNSLMH